MSIAPAKPLCYREALSALAVQRRTQGTQTLHLASAFTSMGGRLLACSAFTAGSAFHAEEQFRGGAVGNSLGCTSKPSPRAFPQADGKLTPS